MKGFYIDITNNLLDPKHLKGMKESVWLFMWLLDKMTSITEEGVGMVLGGKPIKYEEVKDELEISERTYKRWVSTLKRHKYINVKRAPYGLILSVNKAKKRFKRCVKSGLSLRPEVAHQRATNGTSNKTHVSRRSNSKTLQERNFNRLKEERGKLVEKKAWLTPQTRTKVQEEVGARLRSGK